MHLWASWPSGVSCAKAAAVHVAAEMHAATTLMPILFGRIQLKKVSTTRVRQQERKGPETKKRKPLTQQFSGALVEQTTLEQCPGAPPARNQSVDPAPDRTGCHRKSKQLKHVGAACLTCLRNNSHLYAEPLLSSGFLLSA